MTFGEKLKKLIGEKSRARIAEDSGLKPSALNGYVNHGTEPSASAALKLAKNLSVPADWLIDDSTDFPVPHPDLSNVPDDIFMDEACRRLIEQAKRVAYDLERVKKENWSKIADELLAISATDELAPGQERISFILSLLAGALRDLLEFDATHAIKRRRNDGPDLDDLKFYIAELKKMPEFKTLEAYFSLRHVADYLKRHNATQSDWDARDVEGQRKQLIANLASQRKAAKSKKA